MKTVLITGCSSGFGLEAARSFLARDWRVVATMRTPRADVLPASECLRMLALDVTDPASIHEAIEAAGPIDVLVNNAGFGAAMPAELTPIDTVRALFETNTFGTIALTQAVLPQMRARRSGVIVNVGWDQAEGGMEGDSGELFAATKGAVMQGPQMSADRAPITATPMKAPDCWALLCLVRWDWMALGICSS